MEVTLGGKPYQTKPLCWGPTEELLERTAGVTSAKDVVKVAAAWITAATGKDESWLRANATIRELDAAAKAIMRDSGFQADEAAAPGEPPAPRTSQV